MELAAELLIGFLALVFSIQWLGFFVSAILQSELFYDLTGSICFILGACLSLAFGNIFHERQVVITTLVLVWAMRLGTFLFMRVLQAGKDSRFDGVRDHPWHLFTYWTIQGVWVFIVSLPCVALNAQPNNPPWPRLSDIIGLLIWTIGMVVEVTADYQKYFFCLDENNRGRWISTGLWRYSQHPNYFGEILLWWGVFLTALAGLPPVYALAGFLSPAFTTFMLIKVSGIPLLRQSAQKKWGSNPDYRAYERTTSILVPWPPKVLHSS